MLDEPIKLKPSSVAEKRITLKPKQKMSSHKKTKKYKSQDKENFVQKSDKK